MTCDTLRPEPYIDVGVELLGLDILEEDSYFVHDGCGLDQRIKNEIASYINVIIS